MDRSKKVTILLVTFFLLFAVITGEIVFLTVSGYKVEKTQKTNPSEEKTKQALFGDFQKTLHYATVGVLKKSTKIDMYETEIVSVKNSEGVEKGFSYARMLEIAIKEKETKKIYFNDRDLSLTTIVKKDGKKGMFGDLKEGEKIRIEFITNQLEYFSNNTEHINITQLGQ